MDNKWCKLDLSPFLAKDEVKDTDGYNSEEEELNSDKPVQQWQNPMEIRSCPAAKDSERVQRMMSKIILNVFPPAVACEDDDTEEGAITWTLPNGKKAKIRPIYIRQMKLFEKCLNGCSSQKVDIGMCSRNQAISKCDAYIKDGIIWDFDFLGTSLLSLATEPVE